MKDHHPSKGNGIVTIPVYCLKIVVNCVLESISINFVSDQTVVLFDMDILP